MTGLIWKIDRYATHDGPGVRTNLYFKGCPLRCRWCSNPEGQSSTPELLFSKAKCNSCGLCVPACPRQALRLEPDAGGAPTLAIDRPACDICGACVPACPTNALEVTGRRYTVAELVDLADRDRMLHRKSGGGITCTGGDPLYQPEFTLELLRACRRRGIPTVVETSGYAGEAVFRAVIEQADWLFFDVKHLNSEEHLKLTGKTNDLILSNLRLASSAAAAGRMVLAVRMVIVPGMNDGRNIADLADFLKPLPGLASVELLPYHALGAHKYEQLGRCYDLEVKAPEAGLIENYKEVLKARGHAVN